MILTKLVDAAIDDDYYTPDGRVMLPLVALIELGLVAPASANKLGRRLAKWIEAQCINPRAREAGWGVAFCQCTKCVSARAGVPSHD
jgi:hypothetical protein